MREDEGGVNTGGARRKAKHSSLTPLISSGEDRYGYLEHMSAPAGWLLAEVWERARCDTDLKREILYNGVKSETVKENRRG